MTGELRRKEEKAELAWSQAAQMFPREEMDLTLVPKGRSGLSLGDGEKHESSSSSITLLLGIKEGSCKITRAGRPPACTTQGMPWPCHSFPDSLAPCATQLFPAARAWQTVGKCGRTLRTSATSPQCQPTVPPEEIDVFNKPVPLFLCLWASRCRRLDSRTWAP